MATRGFLSLACLAMTAFVSGWIDVTRFDDAGIAARFSTATPIASGSVHVAMSYGRRISFPGCSRTSG